MSTAASQRLRPRRRPPSWALLLALLLYLGGGALAAGHIHEAPAPADHPCDTCLLATSPALAATAAALVPANTAGCDLLPLPASCLLPPAPHRRPQGRAPPPRLN
jgi:hypothetical protein